MGKRRKDRDECEHLRSLGREGGVKGMRGGGEKAGIVSVAQRLIAAVFLFQPQVTLPSQLALPTNAGHHTWSSQCEVRHRVWGLEFED